VDDGVAHAESLGFDNIIAAGVVAAAEMPAGSVYGGFSLGALSAQKLAQTTPGAAGLLLYHGDVPVTAFADSWPAGVDVQLHANEHDEWCHLDVMRDMVEVVSGVATAELFVYPGSSHLFTDSSLEAYEPESARLVLQRTLDFLER
jgi:dienelactone hydrolase